MAKKIRDEDGSPIDDVVCPHCQIKGWLVYDGTRLSIRGMVAVGLLLLGGFFLWWIPLTCSWWQEYRCGQCLGQLSYKVSSPSNWSKNAIAFGVLCEAAVLACLLIFAAYIETIGKNAGGR